MTMCENESTISCLVEVDVESVSRSSNSGNNDSTQLSHLESRYSRLSFQSTDTKKSYRHRVSFNMVSHHPFISYTLRTANEGYQYRPISRLFMVTVDEPGNLDDLTNALAVAKVIRYAMNLVDDGDEVVVMGIQNNIQNDTPTPKEMATQLLNLALESQQHEDKISITVEVAFGKSEQALRIMIQMYEPTMLVVGYRKKSRKSVLLSNSSTQSIINQCLKHTATTPVLFVQHCHDDVISSSSTAAAVSSHGGGHRRTLTACSNPLPEASTCRESNNYRSTSPPSSTSQMELGYSPPRHILRPASIVSTMNITNQLKRTFSLLKK